MNKLGRHLSKEELESAKVFAEDTVTLANHLGITDSVFAYAILILAHKVEKAGYHVVVPESEKQ